MNEYETEDIAVSEEFVYESWMDEFNMSTEAPAETDTETEENDFDMWMEEFPFHEDLVPERE